MSKLPREVEAAYTVIIDEILRGCDLDTVSTKRVRKGLQARVDDDLEPHKEAINNLIMGRYDRAVARQNNAVDDSDSEPTEPVPTAATKSAGADSVKPLMNGTGTWAAGNKRSSTSDPDDDRYEATNGNRDGMTPLKKRHKKTKSIEDSDAAIAARMQAEEYSRARSTRGGGAKRKAVVKKKVRKSKTKVADDLDSDAEASGEKKEVNRTGGFHKPMTLSAPLAALLNENQLSRPQTVKRIWEYIKSHDLQDPTDKRQIRCDDAMRTVFKTDKIHMFTMNKVLNQNLYAVDE